ncbi:universal stress protein [Luteimonas yindakuii]|uniref:universal stress protein n=1 Tax=Luteimonas yindakuii TaxID=2565782 RepID=UPI0031345E86
MRVPSWQHGGRPVWSMPMYTHILATTDGSELALRGIGHAAALAAALDARLTVVTVSEPWNTALADPTGFGAAGELVHEYRAGAREQPMHAWPPQPGLPAGTGWRRRCCISRSASPPRRSSTLRANTAATWW